MQLCVHIFGTRGRGGEHSETEWIHTAKQPCEMEVVNIKIKVTHNTCSLHLAKHFQNQTSHMDMFYMVY